MVYPPADAENGAAEQANSDHPLLRLLTFKDTQASKPATDCKSNAPYVWAASSPTTLSNHKAGAAYPSAACYFAGRDILAALNHTVPVGLITAAWSGSAIESWMTSAMVQDGTPTVLGGNGTCGGTVLPGAAAAAGAAGAGAASVSTSATTSASGGMFYGMIAPLLPMRLTGIFWYQV